MKIVATNIGEKRSVTWKGKTVETGIFKYPVEGSVFLGKTDVKRDQVIDRKYHGGIDKACYAYSADHYPFWQQRFPEVDFTFGAFGENLTIEGLDEQQVKIGDHYQIGKTVIVEVAQPRQPCMKLGIRFNDQKIIKQFISEPFSGVYFRILSEGEVSKGDSLSLIHREKSAPSVSDVHGLLGPAKNKALAEKVINRSSLANSYKNDLKRVYQL